MNTPTEPDLVRILKTFNDRNIEYVLIGGGAALIHGATRATQDLDFLIRNSLENRYRVASALHQLGSRTPSGAAIDHEDLKNTNTLWTTSHGEVDILVTATGPDDTKLDYNDIRPHAVAVGGLIDGQVVLIAALADLIVMKSAAGRPKDLEALPELRQLAAQPLLSPVKTESEASPEPPEH